LLRGLGENEWVRAQLHSIKLVAEQTDDEQRVREGTYTQRVKSDQSQRVGRRGPGQKKVKEGRNSKAGGVNILRCGERTRGKLSAK